MASDSDRIAKQGGDIMTLTFANKVRLWSAAACQLIGLILVLTIPTPDGTQTLYSSTQNGMVNEGWALAFLAAAAVLAGISLYRFLRPAATPQAPPSPLITPPPGPIQHSSGPIQH